MPQTIGPLIYVFRTSKDGNGEEITNYPLTKSTAHLSKKEIISFFGIDRKVLEMYLLRHKEFPTKQFTLDNPCKTKETFIHISILWYLVRYLRRKTGGISRKSKQKGVEQSEK